MECLYNPERRRLAKKFHRRKDRYNWFNRIFHVLFWAIFLGFSLEKRLYHFLTDWTESWIMKLVLFTTGFYIIYTIFNSILDYFEYRLNLEFELSSQSKKEWFLDKVKVLILELLILNIAGGGFLILVQKWPESWWIIYTIIGFIFIILFTFIMPVVLFPLFFKLTPFPNTPLRQRLENLFERAKVKVTDIYEFNLSSKVNSANAAVIGMGKTRKIILSDTLQDKYTEAEIEAILAHEIGHHANGDITKLLLIQFGILLVITYLISLIWQPLVKWWGYDEIDSIASLPMLFLIWGIINWVITPIELYISRRIERKADEYALRLIENPRNLATAFVKLADESLAELKLSLYKLLFKASHPPIDERVKMALEWVDKKE
ncbi:peptidase M48 Ste24p [Anoxybacter fermentans]|uniref:Peptidase M48 Ste24p n=1 Tax=Anoxybacter fermentans TaxID=1323375 RepID=A0A3Q9HPR2_9FIRM|nr:M48 family metalloprotease [Anoxybacter fermentans]AZR72913.1 peptidase M48 Ste24p [Anoxybacter fermentans]